MKNRFPDRAENLAGSEAICSFTSSFARSPKSSALIDYKDKASQNLMSHIVHIYNLGLGIEAHHFVPDFAATKAAVLDAPKRHV